MEGAPKDGQLMELELLLLKFKQSVSGFASRRTSCLAWDPYTVVAIGSGVGEWGTNILVCLLAKQLW